MVKPHLKPPPHCSPPPHLPLETDSMDCMHDIPAVWVAQPSSPLSFLSVCLFLLNLRLQRLVGLLKLCSSTRKGEGTPYPYMHLKQNKTPEQQPTPSSSLIHPHIRSAECGDASATVKFLQTHGRSFFFFFSRRKPQHLQLEADRQTDQSADTQRLICRSKS